jgi:DNA ligase-1
MKFTRVADYFERIEKESSRLAMTMLLAELLKQASPHEGAIIGNISLGQLYPPYIGTQFNMADKSVAKVVAQLLDLSVETIQRHAKDQGDLGLVVETGKWKAAKQLSLEQVYNRLCDLEDISGEGSQEAKQAALFSLLTDGDQQSAKYIVRIIIGKLRLGFSDMTIIDACSWMEVGNKSLREVIENAYNIRADIGLIIYELKEKGIKALEHMKVKVGIPILPAAAERMPTAAAIMKKIGPCVAQPKLDGFRLQIHVNKEKKKPEIHFFSRNLQDMSAMFPDIYKDVEALPVTTMIAEGEAIGYDPDTGSFLPFQETVKRKRKHGIEEIKEELPLQVFIFDVLYLNGVDCLDKTHEQRRALLEQLFKKIKSETIHLIEEVPIQTTEQLQEYFAQNIAAGLEGLVLKRPDAIYQPGKRNFNWIKLKREEEGELEDTIDCVILGYNRGSGKRASFGIGAFLVGVFNKKEDHFETIAKVGTGLKDADWKELKKKCDALAVKEKPKNVVCAKELYPDVWTSPELVCVIRADEITQSPLHTAGKTAHHLGYALRFPRFMGYRPDKQPEQATEVSEIITLYKDQFKK